MTPDQAAKKPPRKVTPPRGPDFEHLCEQLQQLIITECQRRLDASSVEPTKDNKQALMHKVAEELIYGLGEMISITMVAPTGRITPREAVYAAAQAWASWHNTLATEIKQRSVNPN